ncbi:hypothetical protein L1987_89690 [Smallanthus sonchifolius]|nr:hypothetical protein L1987_89690 [Smallanthus sonchifolius]
MKEAGSYREARFFNSSSASFHFDRSRCLLLARCLLNEPLLPARPLSLILSKVQEEEEKRNHRPMVLLRKYGTVCDCSYPTPREVLVTAPQVVSEMLLRGEAEAAKEEKLTLFQKKE